MKDITRLDDTDLKRKNVVFYLFIYFLSMRILISDCGLLMVICMSIYIGERGADFIVRLEFGNLKGISGKEFWFVLCSSCFFSLMNIVKVFNISAMVLFRNQQRVFFFLKKKKKQRVFLKIDRCEVIGNSFSSFFLLWEKRMMLELGTSNHGKSFSPKKEFTGKSSK